MWHQKTTDASWACRMSSPRMNSFVRLAMNIQFVCECCPRPGFMKAFFKMESVSPHAVCRVHCMDGLLSGSPMAMSGLAMFTDTCVESHSTWFLSYPST
jgi:hypothetical protein